MTIKKLCVVLFVILLFAPIVQRLTKVFPSPSLYGVERSVGKPSLRFASWFDGSFRKSYEDYFRIRVGLRPYFIRTFNQFHFSLFGNIPGRRGTQIVIGKDNWLYEREYIRHYVRPGRATPQAIEESVLKLRRFQDALESAGIAFALVVSPSKAEIYPEHIPEEHLTGRKENETNYGRTVHVLDDHGINYVDAHRIFLEARKNGTHDLFAHGGTHWNRYGVFLVIEEVVAKLQPIVKKDIPVPVCRRVRMLPPKLPDRDLELLMNLWRFPAAGVPVPYPELPVRHTTPDERLSLLVIGDSFSFILIDALRNAEIAGPTELLYYYKRMFIYPEGVDQVDHASLKTRVIRRGRFDGKRFLLKKDAVILETNEIFLPPNGWGFVDEAMAMLEKARPAQ